jgi:uncharacterized protein YchJ
MPPTRELTPAKQRVIALLSAGSTATAAAQSVGVHRNTIGNWMRSTPFRDALIENCRDQQLAWREQTRSLAVQGRAPAVPGPAPRPGRNQPCPCGSGKKFKRCCISIR